MATLIVPATLHQLQTLLQHIYDVPAAPDVRDYLITCETTARALAPHAPDGPERLLVAEQEDELALSLYLEESLLRQLKDDDPMQQLHNGNLDASLVALEGLSHFLFLIWSARNDRQTTQLELETQAEVDKFVACSFLVAGQDWGGNARALFDAQFGRPRFASNLDIEQRQRYQKASQLAGSYCRWLLQQHSDARHAATRLTELRRFYRLERRRKISRLERMH